MISNEHIYRLDIPCCGKRSGTFEWSWSKEFLKFPWNNKHNDNITNLVCYTYFHWLTSALNVSIYSENRRGIYFSPQKRLKHGRQNITLHWINGIIRNNKCIFTKLNAVFILKTATWTNKYYNSQFRHKYLIDSANSYVPRLYHNK